ncbi:uncharacterized protein TEOVI_000280200 [Trypanosoma equiperdum]|uniref:Uncharacterized protein n=2 Tax=Trypanozoon TaxID=39700 RepID=Q386Z1_TRYB2|nr:hypothetical protein, conserved [Trypanosoma brucei brucei TREU927]EAN79140.1 hypothetical protein, conserved [Trypanosoma brucei brucei TREU927]SCU71222.1 hypothetical protein, conserved [Trypanosoma equiperdum]
MLRRFALTSSVALRLRFERDSGHNTVRYRPIPESMQPKHLEDNFTPFPLPKFDESLEYGPVRLRNIPDIEAAKERRRGSRLAATEVLLQETLQEENQFATSGKGDGNMAIAITERHTEDVTTPAADSRFPSQTMSPCSHEEEMRGYVVSRDYPLIDRLHCTRSIEELVAQFEDRPQIESRVAALADMASTVSFRSDEELLRMFTAISAPFSVDGRGLNFLTVKVSKFGRPYYVPNSLLPAYVNLVDATTIALVREQPWRLSASPALFIQVLQFMALIKVFEPNKWFTFSDHAPSNRADYRHAIGVNHSTAFWGTGEELYDFMVELLRVEDDGRIPTMLDLCTREQMVDLLSGFCGVMPGGKAVGDVFKTITDAFLRRVRNDISGSWGAHDWAIVERMYLVTVLCDAGNNEILQLLLSDTASPRGPDFFAAVSRTKDTPTKKRALCLLQEAIDNASVKADKVTLLGLLESGSEFLLSLVDKGVAHTFATQNLFDYRILNSFLHCSLVADRLRVEQSVITSRIPSSLRDVQVQMLMSNERNALNPLTSSLPGNSGAIATAPKLKRPLMTMLSQLEYLNSIDSVFILHSSLMATSTDQLVSAVRRLPSGKDSLIVTMSCLRALSVKSLTSPSMKERIACARALEIVSYELEKGRAVLLPFSEEILLHDAGAYCDEDLMLWTVAAFLARELPLVKVHTLMHSNCTARTPYRFLKGGHNLLVSSRSLYDKGAPLLSSLHSKELRLVTHNVRLRTPVRDRKCTLQYYNPIRARFVYRRDKPLFDKYHVTARNLAPGFSRGALKHDWRALGVYTPDHPQVPYHPLQTWMLGETTVEAE